MQKPYIRILRINFAALDYFHILLVGGAKLVVYRIGSHTYESTVMTLGTLVNVKGHF